jgi:Transglycosylase SLT domain
MAEDDVDVSLRFRAVDETQRVTQDMIRRAQEGARQLEAAFQTRQRAIEAMAKRSGVAFEDMNRRVEKASKDSVRAQEEAGRRTQEALKRAAESQDRFTISTEKSSKAMRDQARIASRDLVSGMSQLGRVSLENAQASEKMLAGMSKVNQVAKDAGTSFAQQTTHITSATSALSKWAIGLVTAAKVIGAVKDSYVAFAQQQRELTRVADAWRLNTEEAKQYEEQTRKLSAQSGQSYEELNNKAIAWAATTKLTRDEQIKGWTTIQDYALAYGVKVEDATELANIALNRLNVKLEDLPKTMEKWGSSIPPAAQAAFAEMLNRVMPSLERLENKGVDVPDKIAARLRVLAPAMGGMAKATDAFAASMEGAKDPTTSWGRLINQSMSEYEGKQISFEQLREDMYQQALSQGAYGDRLEQARFEKKFGQSREIIKMLKAEHDARAEIAKEDERAIETIADKKKKLAEDEQSRIDKLAEATAKAQQEGGKAAAPAIGVGIDLATAGLNRATQSQAPGPAVGIGTRRTGRYRGGGFGGTSLGTDGGTLPEIKVTPRAAGGEVDKDKPYLVGEQGPELVMPGQRGQVIPAQETEQAMRRGDLLAGQQAQADQALRGYLAGFRDKGRQMQRLAMLDARPGADLGGGAGAGGGRAGGGGGDPASGTRTGTGGSGGQASGSGSAGDGATDTGLKVPTNLDPASESGPAETLEEAYKRGYLKPPGADPNTPLKAGQGGYVDQAALQDRLAQHIAGTKLNGYVPADGARYGIKTGSPQEWAALMKNLAGGESSFRATTHGDKGSFGGHGSRGLFQLSPADAQTYGLQKTPFTIAQLEDPEFNIKAAVQIAEKRALAGGIGDARSGMAKYWAGAGGRLNRGDYGVKPGQVRPAWTGVAGAPQTSTVAELKTQLEGGVGAPPGGGISRVTERQAAEGATRSLPIQSRLKEQLEYAAAEAGVEVEVYSGGQHEPFRTKSGKMTSHRHDKDAEGKGGAADVRVYVRNPDGSRRLLNSNNPQDAPVMQKFVRESVRAGATGVGHGEGYMGTSSVHIGGGDPASWGGADWIERERLAGVKTRLTPQQFAEARARQRGVAEEATKVAGPAAVSDVETRAAARFAAARERAAGTTVDDSPLLGGKAAGKGARGRTFSQEARHIRRLPYAAPAGEGRAAGKGIAAKPIVVRPVSAPGREDTAAGKGPRPVARPVSEEGSEEKAAGKGLAAGGSADAGMPYMVGEQGPELFTPSQSGNVTSSGNTQAMMEAMRAQWERPIEPVIRPKFQHMGASSARWTRNAERSREQDNSRRAARESHTDLGFA